MNLRQGLFLERPNRFVARVRLTTGEEQLVHVSSSGRMKELLIPGAPVMIRGEGKPGQKTAGLLALVQAESCWVSVDTALPGKILRAHLERRSLAPFAAYTDVRPEFPFGEGRIDFLLTGPGLPPCLIEVKSVTEVLPDPDGTRVARFPDAPTVRGARHLRELVRARSEGYRSAVCFMVQRADADAFGPRDAIDPAFGQALREASGAGLELFAWRLHVSPERIELDQPLPIRL